MNEKIKELIEECTRVENGVMQVRRNETVYHFDKVKFAKLIVRECLSIVDDAERGGSNEVWDNAVKFIRKDLKEHFGVE